MLDMVWLAIAFPLIGALINGLFGKRINNKLVSGVIACSALAGGQALTTASAMKRPAETEFGLGPRLSANGMFVAMLVPVEPPTRRPSRPLT